MLFVFWVHLDLVLPCKAIHKRHYLKATGIVNHDVNDGQWELVFRAGCIKIVVVNTDSNFSILFKKWDNVSNPVWVLLFTNEPYSMSLWTSSSMASMMSVRNCLYCCFTGLMPGLIFNRCMAICGSRLGISP